MKTKNKVLFMLFLALMPLAGNAQKPFYHNIGDTIDFLDTIYWRPAWYDRYARLDTITAQFPSGLQFPRIAGEVLMRCYTDKPLQVIGIASSVKMYHDYNDFLGLDSLRLPEYLRLYQVHPGDSLELKLEFKYQLTDPHRTINIEYKRVPSHFVCDSMILYKCYYPIFEYYAEKAVTISDTFYIGGTDYSVTDEDDYNTYYNIPDYICAGWNSMNSPCKFPESTYRFTNFYQTLSIGGPGLAPNTIQYLTRKEMMYTFPILLIDTTFADTTGGDTFVCPEVKHFRAANTWESGGVMLWDVEVQHSLWQLRLCNAGDNIENPLVDTVINNVYFSFSGLQPETHYDVYIRALCEHYGDTLESDWSGPVDLYTVYQNSAIDQPSDALVQLIPNPAGDATTISISGVTGTMEVSIVDLNGHTVMTEQLECNGDCAKQIQVSGLAKGAYMVHLDGAHVNLVKRLVVK